MSTEEAYQLYLIDANNNANYMSTILWIFFTLFVIAPILYFIICIIATWIVKRRKSSDKIDDAEA